MTALAYLVHVSVAAAMIWITRKRGIEAALPFFCACMLLFPREANLPQPSVFDLTVQRMLVILLAALYLWERRRGLTVQLVRPPLRGLIFVSIAWSLLVNMYSVVPVESAKSVMSMIVEYYVMYFLLVRIISRTETLRNMLAGMVAGMAIASVIGLVEAYSGLSYIALFPQEAGFRFGGHDRVDVARAVRVKSAFQHAILFGGALALAIPQALHLITCQRDKWKKAALWLAVLLMVGASYKTTSRGPWAALGLVMAGLFVFHKPLRKIIAGLGAVLCAGLLMRPGVFHTLSGMWAATFNPDTPLGRSYSYRYALFDVILETLANHPLRQIIGFGQNSFFHLELEHWFIDRVYTFLSCDCAWAAFAIETGYVGLAIMVLLLGGALLIAWRDYLVSPAPDRYFSLLMAGCLAAYYFMMLSVAMYGWGQNSHQLWMLIAMVSAQNMLLRRTETEASVESSTDNTPSELEGVET